jgi:trimeric autotransporter adhesin
MSSLELPSYRPCLRAFHIASSIVIANHGVPIRLAKLARFFKNLRMKTTALQLRNLINRSPVRAFLLIVAALACFALSPTARAVDPPPDGGYPGRNTAEGDSALFSLTMGFDNTAIGFDALYSNTTGNDNTAVGFEALLFNTTGFANTANGFGALASNTTGFANTANGVGALEFNTTGFFNTATGVNALWSNTTGQQNTATGFEALYSNTTGFNNTANGVDALLSNTTGGSNTATGFEALENNTTGNDNTADGVNALFSNTTGGSNTASGVGALNFNTTGFFNTAMGDGALFNNTTGNNNIALGLSAGVNLTTGNNNIDIGNNGVVGESKTIRIGKQGTQRTTFIAGISGATVPTGVAVIVDSSGHLGTTTSSARFKDTIKPMDKASEAILALKPVTFRYKKELDPAGIPQFGLVAEQVAKVNPDLVARDEQGKPYTVRYDAVNAMLLNEFLKAHRKVEEQDHKIQKQEATIAKQQKQIEALTAGLQKVSDQLELSKPLPQVVDNNQ